MRKLLVRLPWTRAASHRRRLIATARSMRGVPYDWPRTGMDNCRWNVTWQADEHHPFKQRADASVRVCHCGKWPDHHIHTGRPDLCFCDECKGKERAR